jgi:hypothetical protein
MLVVMENNTELGSVTLVRLVIIIAIMVNGILKNAELVKDALMVFARMLGRQL